MAAIDERTLTNGATEDWRDFVHTGPGTLAGRYLRTFWQPVVRSQDLAPGRAVPVRVMSEDLTLYRGQNGITHALAFRCAHRGTQLSTGWVEGDNLRCRYHGWMYDPTGQCVQQPAEPQPFCERVRIRAYPTQEYLGFVFLYMSEGEPPPMRRFPELEGAGELAVTLHHRDCNYFNNMDNAVDELHHFFVHWNRKMPVAEQVIPRIQAEETDYGLRITLTRPDEDRTWAWHFYMPGILNLNMTGGYQSLHWRVPIDDESHLIPTTTLMPPGASDRRRAESDGDHDPIEVSRLISATGQKIRSGGMTVEDVDLADQYFPIGDDVTQLGQGAIADRENERLGASDAGVILLRNLWKRELRAFAEGRPLTEWKRATEPLIATERFG
jgi:5,5'-dehydrodivanillate O-demethylase